MPSEAASREWRAAPKIANLFLRPGGQARLPTRIAAPLRRTAPEQWSTRLPELFYALAEAEIAFTSASEEEIERWSTLVHVVAVLAGTGGAFAHSDKADKRAGRVIFDAGYSEARLAKLLSSRGPALRDQLARLARFLAARGAPPLDLRPIEDLIFATDWDEPRAEKARLEIARAYFTAKDRKDRAKADEGTNA